MKTWPVQDAKARWAQLKHRKPDDLIENAMIAATADVWNLTVATRNVGDFSQLGARTLKLFVHLRA